MMLDKKKSLKIILAILAVAVALYIPQIMLRNNIYYISIDINRLNQEYISLKEENRFLAQQLEDIKFKNQITDSLIMREFENMNRMAAQEATHEDNTTKKEQ